MENDQPRIVLHADDDIDDREVLQSTIAELDPEAAVVSTTNGQEAIEKLLMLQSEGLLPCLIILDMNMPILDGRETLEEVRRFKNFDNIPVVIFTTSPRQRYADLALKYEVDIITKPSLASEIKETVQQLLTYCR
ncbi:MAG: response regulator receiver protein [Chitinophagaceae bacterium]|jgi:CheY-like chemotaxis protein|nr:response regulator receiver protein [Chitinophagaceae bacterium]